MLQRRGAQYKTLLRVRKTQEELKAQALAEARHRRQTAEGQRAELMAQRAQLLSEAGERAKGAFDPRLVRLYYQHERHIRHQIDDKDASIRGLAEAEEERRQELEGAMKERRLVERLIERWEEEYRAEVNKDLQALSDEVASSRAAIARLDEKRTR